MNPPRILVVDDDAFMRSLLQRVLSKAGWTTAAAAHGREALAVAQKKAIDLVITDYVMGGMDGFTLLHDLRELPRYAALPAIMLTAHDHAEPVIPEPGQEVACLLHKPFDPAELLAKIRELLGK